MISKFSHFFKQYTLETIFYYFMSFLIISLLLIINLLALYPTTFNKALQYFHYKLCGWHTKSFCIEHCVLWTGLDQPLPCFESQQYVLNSPCIFPVNEETSLQEVSILSYGEPYLKNSLQLWFKIQTLRAPWYFFCYG